MHRRWIVAAPLGLLVVGWLPYPVSSASVHTDRVEVAENRALSAPPFVDDAPTPLEQAPPAPAVVRHVRESAPPPLLVLEGDPTAAASASTSAPQEEPPSDDVKAAIDAVANVDYDDAAAKFERACSHGSAFACGALGKLLATGTGLPKDVERGRGLLKRGCTSEETWACNHLATMNRTKPSPD
jgi:TPR repeat protein